MAKIKNNDLDTYIQNAIRKIDWIKNRERPGKVFYEFSLEFESNDLAKSKINDYFKHSYSVEFIVCSRGLVDLVISW